jgi:hypothetical protein
MTFSATDAAFEGFRVVRRKPVVLLWWTLLNAVLVLAMFAILGGASDSFAEFAMIAEEVEANTAAGQPSPEDTARMFGAMGGVFAMFAWLFPLQLVVTSMLTAAITRSVVRPSESSFGYLRLGMDEVRVFLVVLVLTLLLYVVYVACVLGVVITAVVAGMIGEGWAWLAAAVAVLAAIALMVWLAVRWSLAVPITVAERRMAFFDSFALTRGRFWPLLGMAIIAIVMVIVIFLLTMLVTAPINMMAGFNMFSAMENDDPGALFEMYTLSNPWIVASALASAVVNSLVAGVWYAPFAAAYRDLKGTGTPELA